MLIYECPKCGRRKLPDGAGCGCGESWGALRVVNEKGARGKRLRELVDEDGRDGRMEIIQERRS